mgnify:CR=1 FL=1
MLFPTDSTGPRAIYVVVRNDTVRTIQAGEPVYYPDTGVVLRNDYDPVDVESFDGAADRDIPSEKCGLVRLKRLTLAGDDVPRRVF